MEHRSKNMKIWITTVGKSVYAVVNTLGRHVKKKATYPRGFILYITMKLKRFLNPELGLYQRKIP